MHARAEQGDGNNLKIVKFLTVAAKHCRKAEHSLQLVGAQRRSRLDGAAGSFNNLIPDCNVITAQYFDPDIVEIFFENIDEILKVKTEVDPVEDV